MAHCRVFFAVGIICFARLPFSVSAVEPGEVFSARVQDPGSGKPAQLAFDWGFSVPEIEAYVGMEADAGVPKPLAGDGHGFVRTPYFEIGTLSVPDWFRLLSGSPSHLRGLAPADPTRATSAQVELGDLLLAMPGTRNGSLSNVLSVGLGVPGYASGVFARSVFGDYSGWNHLGTMARLPLTGVAHRDVWSLHLSAAWYHSWFVPSADTHGWIVDKTEQGTALLRQDELWWLDRPLQRAGELDHLQYALGAALSGLRVMVLVQHSLPLRFEAGTSLGASALIRFPFSTDRAFPLLTIDTIAVFNLKNYLDMHGIAPEKEGDIDVQARLLLGEGWQIELEARRSWEPVPKPSIWEDHYVVWSQTWQSGFFWYMSRSGLGVKAGAEYVRDDVGSHTEDYLVSTMAKTADKTKFILDDGTNAILESSLRGDVQTTINKNGLAALAVEGQFGVSIAAKPVKLGVGLRARCAGPGSWWIGQGKSNLDLDHEATLSASASVDFGWTIAGFGTLQLGAKLATPADTSISDTVAHASEAWHWLAKKIELSFSP